MSNLNKRAVLFEYFKNAKDLTWRENGAKLHRVITELSISQVDDYYARIMQEQEKIKSLKERQEAVMYKRWKFPLIFFLIWSGVALYFANSAKPDLMSCMFYTFFAGSYFQELLNNVIHNCVEYKYQDGIQK